MPSGCWEQCRICRSVHPSASLPARPLVHLPIHAPTHHLSTCLSTHPSAHPPAVWQHLSLSHSSQSPASGSQAPPRCSRDGRDPPPWGAGPLLGGAAGREGADCPALSPCSVPSRLSPGGSPRRSLLPGPGSCVRLGQGLAVSRAPEGSQPTRKSAGGQGEEGSGPPSSPWRPETPPVSLTALSWATPWARAACAVPACPPVPRSAGSPQSPLGPHRPPQPVAQLRTWPVTRPPLSERRAGSAPTNGRARPASSTVND